MWQPIATAPKGDNPILLRGPSGYLGIGYRVAVGYWRPSQVYEAGGYWVNHAGDHFTDDGAEADMWMPLPP